MTTEDQELLAWGESYKPEDGQIVELGEGRTIVDLPKFLRVTTLRMKKFDGNPMFVLYRDQLQEARQKIEAGE